MAYLDEGNAHAKDEPDIDHFDVRRFWKGIWNTNIPTITLIIIWYTFTSENLHCCQNQHNCEIHSDYRLKKEPLKEHRRMAHDVQKYGGKKNSEKNAQESSPEDNIDTNSSLATDIRDEHGLVSKLSQFNAMGIGLTLINQKILILDDYNCINNTKNYIEI